MNTENDANKGWEDEIMKIDWEKIDDAERKKFTSLYTENRESLFNSLHLSTNYQTRLNTLIVTMICTLIMYFVNYSSNNILVITILIQVITTCFMGIMSWCSDVIAIDSNNKVKNSLTLILSKYSSKEKEDESNKIET